MIKKWGTRLGFAGLLLAGGMVGTSLFVEEQVRSQGAQFDARTLDSIGAIINASGLATWPRFAADPATCNAGNSGAYYYHTGTNQFRTCNGSAWADGGGGAGQLTDLSDVFIATPTNNQVLRYDGVTDNRWENAAASASALNDLSDVVLTAPSNGQQLGFNGSNWVNVAASSGSLAGLSDTTITGVARLNAIYYNGTVWVNTIPKTRAWLFPFGGFSAGGLAVNGSINTVIATDDSVRVVSVSLPQPIEVDQVAFINGTLGGTGCNSFYGIGLYSLNGNTKIVDTGAITASTNDTLVTTNITNVFVDAGDYWLAFTSDDTTCEWYGFGDNEAAPIDYENFINQTTTMLGTATNPGLNGALPATLGTITLNNVDWDAPWVKFIGTDP